MSKTNVRLKSLARRALPFAIGTLDVVVPPLAARWAADLFSTPPPRVLSARAKSFLDTGRPFVVMLEGTELAAWSWGNDGRHDGDDDGCHAGNRRDRRTVVLYHGWGGRASQMSAFVGPLVDAGFRVIALDAPGHGCSGGRRSALPLFARALHALVAEVGPIHGLIAHSMGGAASAMAMKAGLPVERAVFIGSPQSPSKFASMFGRYLHLSDRTLSRMFSIFEQRYDLRWPELSVPYIAPGMQIPLLVIHDEQDDEVSHEDGVAIVTAWPGARLITTSGLGHRKILRDPSVIAAAARFVAE